MNYTNSPASERDQGPRGLQIADHDVDIPLGGLSGSSIANKPKQLRDLYAAGPMARRVSRAGAVGGLRLCVLVWSRLRRVSIGMHVSWVAGLVITSGSWGPRLAVSGIVIGGLLRGLTTRWLSGSRSSWVIVVLLGWWMRVWGRSYGGGKVRS